MSAVGPKEAVVYGLEVIIYLAGFAFVGGLLFIIGNEIDDIGFLISALGGAIMVCGFVGMQYKILADAVRKGAHG